MTWSLSSLARRKLSRNSLVAIRPLAGRTSVEPSIISGASIFTWATGTTFRKWSPRGLTATPLSSSMVSMASVTSLFGIAGNVIV